VHHASAAAHHPSTADHDRQAAEDVAVTSDVPVAASVRPGDLLPPATALPVTRAHVAAAQAGVVTMAQGHRTRAHVRDVQEGIGMPSDQRSGRLDDLTRARLVQCLGDDAETVSPSADPRQRAARRLVSYWIREEPHTDPVVIRGFQGMVGVRPTGRFDVATSRAIAREFGRA
jgi:hypothetical protein